VDRIDIGGFESTRTFDANGIILSAKRYHPLSIAQFGVMAYYNFKSTNDSAYYRKCINQINYFKDSTKVNYLFDNKGIGLPYNFDFWDMKAPWYSGMTQGYAISFLLRYYELTNDEEVLPIIEKIAFVLLQKQEDGGTISTTKEGYTWIEEYPNSKRSPQVLNGYINGLIGLKEYVDFFPNDTSAKRFLSETYIGLINSLEYFDSPTWSFYNRANRSLENNYLQYQIYEMKHLFEIFHDETFDNQMRIWSVLSYNKFIDSTFKAIKFPNHNISVPAERIDGTRYGILPDNKTHVLTMDSVINKSCLSSRHFKKSFLRKVNREPNHTFYSFADNGPGLSNYLEISSAYIDENSEIQVYQVAKKKKLKPYNFIYDVSAGKIRISYSDTDLSNIVFRWSGEYFTDSATLRFDFYNNRLRKPPFFGHFVSTVFKLNKDQMYKVSLDTYNTGKVKIFFKSAKNASEMKSSKVESKKHSVRNNSSGGRWSVPVYDRV
jgi:hypothetical protein